MPDVLTLDRRDRIAAVTHPVRAALLVQMRTPTTAAEAARRIGQSRQNAAYHVKELEKAGLLRHAGERKKGNFVEQLYVTAAPSVVISPRSIWGADPRRADALADQLSLGELVRVGEQLQRDAAALLDRAAFDGDTIASASTSTEIRFASEVERAAFLRDFLDAVTELVGRHASKTGQSFRLLLAAYANPEEA